MDGESERAMPLAAGGRCASPPSLSKVAKVGEGVLFRLLHHARVHHPHGARHPHVHPHPHHALVGGHAHTHPHPHAHPHARAHPHASPGVHHGIYRWSDCRRSKAHGSESLGEHVARGLVAWKPEGETQVAQ